MGISASCADGRRPSPPHSRIFASRLALRWSAAAGVLVASVSLLVGNAPAHARDRTPPNLIGATVHGTTLTLTYDEPLNEAVVPGVGLYEVTAGGAEGGRPGVVRWPGGTRWPVSPGASASGRQHRVSHVAVSGKTVKLTLTPAVLPDDSVTMSYMNGAYITTVSPLLDLAGNMARHVPYRAVTNTTTNSAPVYSGPALTLANAPPGALIGFDMPKSRFSDPDGDAVTLSLSGRRDVLTDLYYGTDERVYVRTKAGCVLANFRWPPDNPLNTGITVTASDPHGAVARVRQPLTVHYACPLLSSAVARDYVLTLTYDSLPTGWSPAAGEFTVKVDRIAVALAATSPVSVSGSTVTLTLAAPIANNQTVTVSHAPGADPKTTGFTDRAARVDSASANNAPVPIAPNDQVQRIVPRSAPRPGATVELNANPGTITYAAEFSDPDGEELTLSVNTDGGFGAVTATRFDSTVILHTKTNCEMRRITPAPPGWFKTVVAVAASDPAGATTGLTIVATTRWDPERCPSLSRAAVNGAKLTLTYDKELHSGYVPRASAFDVRVNGSAVALAETTPVVSGKTVVLTLAAPVAGGDAVTLSFTSDFWNEIRSRRGDEAENFSNLQVINLLDEPSGDGGTASVTGVAVASSAGADKTYGDGDTIRVQVTFGGTVDVTGTPRLKIDMDPLEWGEKWAVYQSGSGTSSLTFAHTVVEPNISTQGIAVLANTLELNNGTIRSGDADADLTHTGLAHDANHKVDWRPDISVADARANEGAGASVAFVVSLSRAFTGTEHRVTVDYATADGTAAAGADYTAASGTLTFAAGERTKTVSVPVLEDSHDDGEETFTLRLSNATGARIGDGEATGTIGNADPMPRAWLARFGRTLAEQVVAGVQARLEAPRGGGAHARIAGQELAADGGRGADEADQELARWLAGTPEQPRTMTGGELLAGSAFSVTATAAEEGPSAALWGRGEWSRFDGREGEGEGEGEESLSVDGEVTTALLGAELASGAWLGGVMLSHARGDGNYRDDAGAGTVASALTAVHPYVGVDLSERLTAWAAGGLGLGGLTLTPEGAGAMETDLALVLAALGARGRLVEPAAGSGFLLAIETDAYWVRTSSAATTGLAEAQADATRIRLGVDGGYRFALPGGGTLGPTVAIGVRHDGGHAETGYGMDLGGGLAWSAPALGLSAEVAARGLLTLAFDGFRDLGLSGSLAWNPDPASDRGPSMTVTQTLGAAAAGRSHALLGRPTLTGLAATEDGLDHRRLDLRAGYGFAAADDRFTMTPELGLSLSEIGRDYTVGWRLGIAQPAPVSFELGVEATRRETGDRDPEHDLGFTMTASW